MTSVKDIYTYIDTFAPFHSAMDFDNVGILVGDPADHVRKCVVCLDVTKESVDYACRVHANLMISHHPVIFHALKRVMSDSIISSLLTNQISVISAHTNYDLSPIGVNYQLAEKIGLNNIKSFKNYRESGCFEGYWGELAASLKPQDFALHIKNSLSCQKVSFTMGSKPVKRVAVGCGAGSDIIFDAAELGVDAFVSGESKHHELLFAKEAGITFVTAGHFETEVFSMKKMAEILKEEFHETEFLVVNEISPVLCL